MLVLQFAVSATASATHAMEDDLRPGCRPRTGRGRRDVVPPIQKGLQHKPQI